MVTPQKINLAIKAILAILAIFTSYVYVEITVFFLPEKERSQHHLHKAPFCILILQVVR
jgi:hypothetical protein